MHWQCYLKLDRSVEAVEALKKALDLDPKDNEARAALIWRITIKA